MRHIKKIAKVFFSFFLIITIAFGLFSFKVYKNNNKAFEFLKEYIAQNCYSYNAKYSKEEKIIFCVEVPVITYKENKELDTNTWEKGVSEQFATANELLNGLAITFKNKSGESIGRSYERNDEMANSFKETFGATLYKPDLKIKYKQDGKVYSQTIPQYNGQGMQVAFDKLYKKPETTIEGLMLQKIYNCMVKNDVRKNIEFYNKIFSNKAVFEKFALGYKNKLQKNPFSHSNYYLDEKDLKIFKIKDFDELKENYGLKSLREMGLILRRYVDGSLPTLIKCFKQIVKDYDPEIYSSIKF